ncbi:dienelactone hydrolase family protein [Aminipila sp.]|uniref:dienelactone hydrolase family protein n=1 Tax=Aminipila sp. TaxID=2060095 RepID=UPI0028A1348F|nr:dienelactone hydrolase family protein [Aminipila sp.]
MIKYIKNSETAIIVLHEIYGRNDFIKDVCAEYFEEGFDVYCPNLLATHKTFSYEETEEAYSYFINGSGFDVYSDILCLIQKLKEHYKKVIVLGFSIGATVAWRCCESAYCDGIIACYGSRIRDYLNLKPKCQMFLMFAEQDSFDVNSICEQLLQKPNLEIMRINAQHGFLDKYSKYYNPEKTKVFKEQREIWLNHYK